MFSYHHIGKRSQLFIMLLSILLDEMQIILE